MPPFFDVHGDPTMDPYTILSLPPTASETEIKKAYRMQMLQLHPDKLSSALGENSIAEVTEKFHNVKDAYEFLMSPMHLTSRRLYMAKMASRRAEYERREAFLRRNGGVGGANYSTYTREGVSGYASGGGGAAGMAGTGFSTARSNSQHHGQSGNSYPMPSAATSKNKMHRSQSEPVFEGKGGRDDRRRRSGKVGGEARHSKHMGGQDRGRTGGDRRHSSSKPKDGKGRERNGYKSDSYATKTNKTNHREGRSNKPQSSSRNNKERHHRQRTKSEPRRDKQQYESSEGEKKSKVRKSRDATSRGDTNTAKEQQRQREQKRRRARSAPARYSNKSTSGNKYKDLKYDKNNPNSSLPKEFLCPLTKRLMKDPVKDTEGNTYEREAIERWLRVQSSSPITNGFLSMDMLRPDREMKRAIYKVTGKPRSKSQNRTKSRSTSPTELVSGRVLVDSYLREISSKSKLSVSLDGMGVCAFSYRRITFVIEVPITPHAGFMVYSSFDGEAKKYKLAEKMVAWNTWLSNIGRHSQVSYVRAGHKTVFTLKGNELDMSTCDVFQKTLEYFVTMSLKLHNLLHPMEARVVENVSLTRSPVVVA